MAQYRWATFTQNLCTVGHLTGMPVQAFTEIVWCVLAGCTVGHIIGMPVHACTNIWLSIASCLRLHQECMIRSPQKQKIIHDQKPFGPTGINSCREENNFLLHFYTNLAIIWFFVNMLCIKIGDQMQLKNQLNMELIGLSKLVVPRRWRQISNRTNRGITLRGVKVTRSHMLHSTSKSLQPSEPPHLHSGHAENYDNWHGIITWLTSRFLVAIAF